MGVCYIGYKGFDENLKAFNGFQYEVGKTYEMDDLPKIGLKGFHFYNNLLYLFEEKYSITHRKRICVIKAYGEIDSDMYSFCTNKIEILKEINIPVIDKLKYTYAFICGLSFNKLKLLDENFDINELIYHENLIVRECVADYGFGLNKLINDESYEVRIAVVKQGYGLDKLINDEDWRVRRAVAEQGYGLDKLINDEDWGVRRAIADYGFGLNKLINDEDWRVRIAVVKQGYGLDKLINDENYEVRKYTYSYIYEKYPDIKEKVNNYIINLLKDK